MIQNNNSQCAAAKNSAVMSNIVFAKDGRSARFVVKVDCKKKFYFDEYGYVLAFCATQTDFYEVSIKMHNSWYGIATEIKRDMERVAEVAAEYVDGHGDQISIVDDEGFHDYMEGKFGDEFALSISNVAQYISVVYGYNIDEIIRTWIVPYNIILSRPVADPIAIDIPSRGITMAEAIAECEADHRCYIAWTYGGYENERDWPTRAKADAHKYRTQIPKYAATKEEAAKYWPTMLCLFCGSEYGGEIVDQIIDPDPDFGTTLPDGDWVAPNGVLRYGGKYYAAAVYKDGKCIYWAKDDEDIVRDYIMNEMTDDVDALLATDAVYDIVDGETLLTAIHERFNGDYGYPMLASYGELPFNLLNLLDEFDFDFGTGIKWRTKGTDDWHEVYVKETPASESAESMSDRTSDSANEEHIDSADEETDPVEISFQWGDFLASDDDDVRMLIRDAEELNELLQMHYSDYNAMMMWRQRSDECRRLDSEELLMISQHIDYVGYGYNDVYKKFGDQIGYTITAADGFDITPLHEYWWYDADEAVAGGVEAALADLIQIQDWIKEELLPEAEEREKSDNNNVA